MFWFKATPGIDSIWTIGVKGIRLRQEGRGVNWWLITIEGGVSEIDGAATGGVTMFLLLQCWGLCWVRDLPRGSGLGLLIGLSPARAVLHAFCAYFTPVFFKEETWNRRLSLYFLPGVSRPVMPSPRPNPNPNPNPTRPSCSLPNLHPSVHIYPFFLCSVWKLWTIHEPSQLSGRGRQPHGFEWSGKY